MHWRSGVAFVAGFCFTGCSFFGPKTQVISVSSDPPAAEVIVNGERVGKTPLSTQVSRAESVLIEIRKPGYETQFRSTTRTISTLGVLDVIGGFLILVPFLGLLSPAAWSHEPTNFGVILPPEEKPRS